MTEKKEAFIKVLAEYLVGDQSTKSINLQLGTPGMQDWALLRNHTPLQGYPSVEAAVETLTEFLN